MSAAADVLYAPPGHWRVICVQLKPKQDWVAGDRETRAAAIELARAEAAENVIAYVYNEHGACSFNQGGRRVMRDDPYRKR